MNYYSQLPELTDVLPVSFSSIILEKFKRGSLRNIPIRRRVRLKIDQAEISFSFSVAVEKK